MPAYNDSFFFLTARTLQQTPKHNTENLPWKTTTFYETGGKSSRYRHSLALCSVCICALKLSLRVTSGAFFLLPFRKAQLKLRKRRDWVPPLNNYLFCASWIHSLPLNFSYPQNLIPLPSVFTYSCSHPSHSMSCYWIQEKRQQSAKQTWTKKRQDRRNVCICRFFSTSMSI